MDPRIQNHDIWKCSVGISRSSIAMYYQEWLGQMNINSRNLDTHIWEGKKVFFPFFMKKRSAFSIDSIRAFWIHYTFVISPSVPFLFFSRSFVLSRPHLQSLKCLPRSESIALWSRKIILTIITGRRRKKKCKIQHIQNCAFFRTLNGSATGWDRQAHALVLYNICGLLRSCCRDGGGKRGGARRRKNLGHLMCHVQRLSTHLERHYYYMISIVQIRQRHKYIWTVLCR